MENKTTFTPGPGDIIAAVTAKDWRSLILSASMELDWSDTPDRKRASAEHAAGLIAHAAPELLAVLESIERYLIAGPIKTRGDRDFVLKDIRAAIAKAQGAK